MALVLSFGMTPRGGNQHEQSTGFGLRHACIIILPLTATHPLPPNLIFPYQQMGLKMPACQIGMRRKSARLVAACDMGVIVIATLAAK